MNTDKEIGYSISKGYPFDKAISKERFVNRPLFFIDKSNNKIMMEVHPDHYPTFKGIKWYHRLFAGKLIDWFMFRGFDYAEALVVSEQQIESMLTEQPFIPEEFGFEKILKPKDIHDNPMVIYQSKFNPNVTISRSPKGNYEWILMIKEEDKDFKDITLSFPYHRIAYATLKALNIQIEGEQEDDNK